MLAGVPSRTPSQSSRSAAPADSAGLRTGSAPSTMATPSLTASSTACIAGDGVWWTTRRRGTVAFSPVVGDVPAGTSAQGRPLLSDVGALGSRPAGVPAAGVDRCPAPAGPQAREQLGEGGVHRLPARPQHGQQVD